ncbi:MAG: hypothetical protein ACRD1A_06800 [Terriglobales bacterium]
MAMMAMCPFAAATPITGIVYQGIPDASTAADPANIAVSLPQASFTVGPGRINFTTVILGEVRFGILLLPRGARRTRLEGWFEAGVQRLQCVPWGAETGMCWAQLLATLRTSGRSIPIKDSLIAATALVHDLTVATRNPGDFQPAGMKIVNPFREPLY